MIFENESNSECIRKDALNTFDELNLKKELLRGIYAFGFETPSFIQQLAIKPIIEGKDLIAQAQSGSGKTGAFVIGSLQVIDSSKEETQVLVLAPTRELAGQTAENYNLIGEYMKINVLCIFGGTKLRDNIKDLEKGPQVIVGSPGRIIDLLNRGHLKLSALKCLILDEADELLGRGFLEDMKNIINQIPPEAKINLFSATLPSEIVQITDKFMSSPEQILVKNEEVSLKGITQYYVTLKKEWKLETLMSMYKCLDITQAIIFCNSIKSVELLTEEMKKNGHMISSIHAQMEMSERNRVMNQFRKGATRVLISTDLTSRGIDIANISLVINYDIPLSKETYIHRIGRSGRFGKKGNAINFVLPEEKDMLDNISKFYDISILQLPTNLSEL